MKTSLAADLTKWLIQQRAGLLDGEPEAVGEVTATLQACLGEQLAWVICRAGPGAYELALAATCRQVDAHAIEAAARVVRSCLAKGVPKRKLN